MERDELEKKLLDVNIPEVTMNEHKEVLKKNLVFMPNTAFLGVAVVIVIAMGVERLSYFLDMPSLLFVTGIPLFLILASYGWNGFLAVFKAPFQMNISGSRKDLYISVLADLRKYIIVSGWMGFLLGSILMVNTRDLGALPLVEISRIWIVATITILYGYFLAYFFTYPVQRRIEHNNR